jgi:LPXTG-site transpeptidase (sortase) family protein
VATVVALLAVLLAPLPVTAEAASVGLPQAMARSAPRLVIPEIRVNAPIVAVGIRNGQLDVGGSPHEIYRWRFGVRPGQPGSAVLAGHTWSRGDGVFDKLGRLRKGHRVRVGTAQFRVTRVQRVRRLSSKQVRELFSDRGRPRLVLITCGDRDDASGVYRTRIIVRARKVGG